jgi:hypothetical protein
VNESNQQAGDDPKAKILAILLWRDRSGGVDGGDGC